MKQRINQFLAVCALLLAFSAPAGAEESKRGFYEGDLTGGGRIVFFVQGNHSISSYIFDTTGQQASFGGGKIEDDGNFTLTTNRNNTITGTINSSTVTANVLGQNVTAERVPVFGGSDDIGGRFTTTATSSSGASFDVKIVIDSQNRIFLVAKQGDTVLGGFGTVTVAPISSPTPSPTASPTPSASPSPTSTPSFRAEHGSGEDSSPTPTPTATSSPSPTASPTASPTPSASPDDNDDDDNGEDADDDHRGHHEFEDEDETEDHHEDRDAQAFNATFTVTLVTGETVTGHLTFSHGLLLGDFTLNGVVYRFRAPQESSENHLANISTRGFVNTGQGQLIGGFIITGGPKLVLVRALGPSLAASGVEPVLADPQLKLFQNGAVLAENDDWQSNSNLSDLNATNIPPQNAKEAALLIRLEPGFYTTVVSGADDGTGISLVEVYEIDRD